MNDSKKIVVAGGSTSIGQYLLKNFRKHSPLTQVLRDIQRSQYPKPKQNKRDIYKSK